MPIEDWPPAMLAKHPELREVEMALNAYREGRAVTIACRTCDKPIAVTDVTETGDLWVRCQTGCTSFRAARQKATEK